ncbi:hypothetical protein M9435_006546 [Picochlorum sp. BPE23]|nr:hypothetical protein M9435_006546 [Picochlorum sp. BPE23]
MVLTRRQEALLKKQYKIVDSDDEPSTPRAARHSISEQHTGLRSALKKYHTDRPWEERERRMMNNLPAVDTNKHVTIESDKNVVFEFETSQGGDSDLSSVKRQLHMENDDEGVESNKKTRQVFGDGVMAFLMLSLWSISSSWLTVVMQTVLSQPRLSLPLMVPGLSQLGCVVVVILLAKMRVIKVNPMPPRAEYVRKIVPLGLATCTCMFLGNYAYIGLSLSFISILKALTPAVTLILAVMWGMEKMSGVAFVSTLLIAYGTGTATVDETNKEADFHWLSFISFTTSILFEASRVVFVSIALKGTKYSSFDLLAGVGPLIFAVLSSLSLVMEWDTLVDLTSAEVIYLAYMMVLIVLLSFLVNISTYAAIKYSSSTTVKVVGCLKNALLMWFGILFQGDIVSKTQWQGFALSTGGFLLYAYARKEQQQKK